jgi:N-acetylmuramoyl-L-alanine amidase
VSPIAAPSPNFDARLAPPDMLILHYTGMTSGEAALARLRDPEARVSAHYLVEEDGRVFALVDEARRAWHAGRSFWRGRTDINARSIGIEIVNPGHEFGYRPFTAPQIEAVIALLDDIRSRWTIPDPLILGHSDVAPERKEDPGELFPWDALAARGHGLWANPGEGRGGELGPGDEGLGVLTFQSALARFGYQCPRTGVFDDHTRIVTVAFQRHWRPSRFDGQADPQTRARLIALLRAADVALES